MTLQCYGSVTQVLISADQGLTKFHQKLQIKCKWEHMGTQQMDFDLQLKVRRSDMLFIPGKQM